MSLLYKYIVSPVSTMRTYHGQLRATDVAFVLAMLSFTSISAFHLFIAVQFVFGILGWALLIFIHSVITDIVAQLLGFEGRAIALFKWMCLANLPFVLLPIIHSVFGWGLISPVGGLFSLLLWVAVWILQIRSIETQYNMSLKMAVITFFAPVSVCILLGLISLLFWVVLLV
jgi:hypothetical protein